MYRACKPTTGTWTRQKRKIRMQPWILKWTEAQQWKRLAGSRLGRMPLSEKIAENGFEKQVRRADQALYPIQDVVPDCMPRPPAKKWKSNKFYIYWDGSHTRPATAGLSTEARAMRWRWEWRKMEVKWKWKWNESYLTRTRRGGTQQKRGGTKRKHQHQHTWPGAGEPWKDKGKEKARADGRADPDPRRGGEDGSAWTNLHRRKQSLPTQTRTKPTWRREHAWN